MIGRYIAVAADMLNPQHRLHPASKGERACRGFAWIDLIGYAAWRDHGGLRRGQAKASQRFLATRWNWTRPQVQSFLDELEADGCIMRQRGSSREPDRITICNYDAYQDSRSTNGATKGATKGAKEVPLPLPTNNRARARSNGERRPPRPVDPIDMNGATARPELIRGIIDGLTGQQGRVS